MSDSNVEEFNRMYSKTDARTRFRYMNLELYEHEMPVQMSSWGQYGWEAVSIIPTRNYSKYLITFKLRYWIEQEEETYQDTNE